MNCIFLNGQDKTSSYQYLITCSVLFTVCHVTNRYLSADLNFKLNSAWRILQPFSVNQWNAIYAQRANQILFIAKLYSYCQIIDILKIYQMQYKCNRIKYNFMLTISNIKSANQILFIASTGIKFTFYILYKYIYC